MTTFKVGQIRLCKRTWVKYTVLKVNDDESVVLLYWCACHDFPHIKGRPREVYFKKGFEEDRIIKNVK